MFGRTVVAVALMSALFASSASAQTVSGEQKKWHPVTLTFDGPQASEADAATFRDHRMTVTFTHTSGATYEVPGYFAADGDAGTTGATAGDKWRVHFTPDRTGDWSWTASFVEGTDAAIDPNVGAAAAFDGETGTLTIDDTDKTAPDHRARGMLRHTGSRYLQFDDGTPFIKGGADSPETLLAFGDFDDTPSTHAYGPHMGDFTAGDPTWGNDDRGQALIGALNYLAGEGMVAFSFLTMNVGGDGDDVWPWTTPDERTTYDVSKLDQWDVVFTHADHLGLFKHFKTQETENDQLLDGGDLGVQRRLYYRELIARFAHHHALNWNLGEEWDVYEELNDNDFSRLQSYATYFHDLDPYDHPVVVHTYPGQHDDVYEPMLGFVGLEGPSIQLGGMSRDEAHDKVRRWVTESEASGVAWNVSIDEPGNAAIGVSTDDVDGNYNHDEAREVLWATLMMGGDGIEWYFGYQEPNDDLDCEDWRSRSNVWAFTGHAMDFFSTYMPMFQTEVLSPENATEVYVLGAPDLAYAVYMVNGAREDLDLSGASGNFEVKWYDPRNGGALQDGDVTVVMGGGMVALGDPPAMSNQDWVALVRKDGAADPYALVVDSGQGDGDYLAGARIVVTADPGDFMGWEGDTAILDDPTAPTTTVTMPAMAATVTATFGMGGGDDPATPDAGPADMAGQPDGGNNSPNNVNGTPNNTTGPSNNANNTPGADMGNGNSGGGLEENSARGCGCASARGAEETLFWGLLIGLVMGWRRRR